MNYKGDLLKFREELFNGIINEIDISEEGDDNYNKTNFIPISFRNRIQEQTISKSGECLYCRKIYKIRKKTIYYCEKCKKHLHPECFGPYHSLYIYNLKK